MSFISKWLTQSRIAKQKGFTLLEALFSAAILSLTVSVVVKTIQNTNTFSKKMDFPTEAVMYDDLIQDRVASFLSNMLYWFSNVKTACAEAGKLLYTNRNAPAASVERMSKTGSTGSITGCYKKLPLPLSHTYCDMFYRFVMLDFSFNLFEADQIYNYSPVKNSINLTVLSDLNPPSINESSKKTTLIDWYNANKDNQNIQSQYQNVSNALNDITRCLTQSLRGGDSLSEKSGFFFCLLLDSELNPRDIQQIINGANPQGVKTFQFLTVDATFRNGAAQPPGNTFSCKQIAPYSGGPIIPARELDVNTVFYSVTINTQGKSYLTDPSQWTFLRIPKPLLITEGKRPAVNCLFPNTDPNNSVFNNNAWKYECYDPI